MLPSLPPAVDADLLYFTISYSYYQYYYEQNKIDKKHYKYSHNNLFPQKSELIY
jgi:hypothetical protein